MTFVAMLYTTRAIVLRTVKFGETSLIADLFTEQKGLQTFIFNSVRKAKASTPPSHLQLMSLVEIVAYFKEQQQIHRTREIRLDHPWRSIPFDMRKSSVITCLAEICSKCIKTSDPHPELFDFLHESLITYDDPELYDRDFLIRFLVSLSHHLGFGLELPKGKAEGMYFDLKEGHIISNEPSHPYRMSMDDLMHLKSICRAGHLQRSTVSLQVRRRLVDQLILYYQLHVESLGEVHSVRILRDLMEEA